MGLRSWIRSRQAVGVVHNVLNNHRRNNLWLPPPSHTASELANLFVNEMSDAMPGLIAGRYERLPHTLAFAAGALSLGARACKDMPSLRPSYQWVLMSLGMFTAHLSTNALYYDFTESDTVLVGIAVDTFEQLIKEYTESDLSRQLDSMGIGANK